jgi:hypothetical protein
MKLSPQLKEKLDKPWSRKWSLKNFVLATQEALVEIGLDCNPREVRIALFIAGGLNPFVKAKGEDGKPVWARNYSAIRRAVIFLSSQKPLAYLAAIREVLYTIGTKDDRVPDMVEISALIKPFRLPRITKESVFASLIHMDIWPFDIGIGHGGEVVVLYPRTPAMRLAICELIKRMK